MKHSTSIFTKATVSIICGILMLSSSASATSESRIYLLKDKCKEISADTGINFEYKLYIQRAALPDGLDLDEIHKLLKKCDNKKRSDEAKGYLTVGCFYEVQSYQEHPPEIIFMHEWAYCRALTTDDDAGGLFLD